MRTGIANLPLHYGKTPRWLFKRMKILAREIALVMVGEFGTQELLQKLSDPLWFQCFGCVLGFDWHSSGLTTTACAALKEGIRGLEEELGLYVAGGKGATSRCTPQEIEARGGELDVAPAGLVYASRLVAKVDSAGLQDGYQIYHHTFVFDQKGNWCVVQQGMNTATRYARRYHWLSEGLQDFVCEPHAAVCCDKVGKPLNMVALESQEARKASAALSRKKPWRLIKELKRLKNLNLASRHQVALGDIHPDRLGSIFLKIYERQPEDFEQLIGLPGVGPKTICALSLLSELIYGAEASFRDPVRYSFAYGGKDGHPYPVDRANYDRSIVVLKRAIRQAKLGRREKLEAFRRLASWEPT